MSSNKSTIEYIKELLIRELKKELSKEFRKELRAVVRVSKNKLMKAAKTVLKKYWKKKPWSVKVHKPTDQEIKEGIVRTTVTFDTPDSIYRWCDYCGKDECKCPKDTSKGHENAKKSDDSFDKKETNQD